MTDPEKDREAVEWGERMLEGNWQPRAYGYMAQLLSLAREALAMRERGPVGYAPEGVIYEAEEDIRALREWIAEGHPIVPLYAGDPVEVSDG